MKKISLYILFIFISLSYAWELTLHIEDINDEASDDYLIIGICDDCHDGFHYGEDVYDLPIGFDNYTDIHFFNLDWVGDVDSNGNECCDNPRFHIDKKSIHPPSDLLEWNIRGLASGHNSPLLLTWEMEELSEDYEIYLYIGEEPYNLRTENSIPLEPGDLPATWEQIDGEWVSIDNIKLLIGGCAATGTEAYYIDSDGDGLGTGLGYDFCPGLQPEGYVDNNSDIDDSIFCSSNIIDDCNVCDGGNADQDCAGVCFGTSQLDECGVCDGGNADQDCAGACFGTSQLDDCGVCDGGNADQDCAGACFGTSQLDDCDVCDGENQSCLDQIFYHLPYNVHALIEESSITVSWNFDLNLEETPIQGFNLYHGNDESNIILLDTIQDTYYQTNQFSEGIFCVSIYDNYDNESDLTCTTASQYNLISYDLHEGGNLVSFPYIPENNSVSFLFDDIKYELDGIIGEGVAATYNENLEMWIGSLEQINCSDGYWLKMLPDIEITLNILGFPCDENIIYNLEEVTLISYLGQDNLPLDDAVPDQFIDNITAIIGEGVAATYNENLGRWVGSLTYLTFGAGYWIKTETPTEFFWQQGPENFILKKTN